MQETAETQDKMDYKYEEIIKKYFGLNKANSHLVYYGNDLTGLLHSASLVWHVSETRDNYTVLKNEVEEIIRMLETTPWYTPVRNEVKDRLTKVIQQINSKSN